MCLVSLVYAVLDVLVAEVPSRQCRWRIHQNLSKRIINVSLQQQP
jgi:hypothetical protein